MRTLIKLHYELIVRLLNNPIIIISSGANVKRFMSSRFGTVTPHLRAIFHSPKLAVKVCDLSLKVLLKKVS